MRARQGYVILAGLLAAIGPVTRFAQAQNWSPGGRWVAYSLAESPAQAWPGWVFGSEEPAGNQKADPTVYRVWTTEVETGDSVLLYESLEPTTQPGWKLDGTALAYGRVRTEKAGAKRLELIVQNAPDRFQVVESAPLGGMADLRRLVDLPVLWSPEGRFLVVPRLEPEGLAVVKVENGSVAFNLNGASRASWSPDGARLVYFRQAN
ncbi:MAG TPA: hypothetical protein VFT74_08025, partial [Isosphaeraceae bacterium]|nr:hypothetical protein [Isosphaeraceae bacterium]